MFNPVSVNTSMDHSPELKLGLFERSCSRFKIIARGDRGYSGTFFSTTFFICKDQDVKLLIWFISKTNSSTINAHRVELID